MQDEPRPPEILAAVARYLRDVVAPETTGHINFNVRVCANALEMMRRHLELAPAAEAAERDRLKALLGMDGDLLALNTEFCRRLESGAIDPQAPAVREHLWETTLTKLAVDQPAYWGYRAALAERPPAQET
ncbi:MAG: hypothetical protein JWO83_4783 [Caulobacteraceae bacterium]|jgi:hypothetical protein|nr:hypothetical protein [Caulobacteraceae bacterium]